MILSKYESEVICDLAETYHVFNYQELSADLVATLVFGLRDNSRLKMKIADTKLTTEQMLSAMIVDDLNFIAWTKTKDAKHGRFKQKSILKTLLGEYKKQKDDLVSFASIEEYEEHMKQFLK